MSSNIGYDNSTNGTLELLPLEMALDDKSSMKFSGLKMDVAASAQAQKVKADGYMDSLKLTDRFRRSGAGIGRTERSHPGQQPDQKQLWLLHRRQHPSS